MPLHDTSYKHWAGRHLGIWQRRAVIAANGLRGALKSKWLRHLIVVCWTAALAQTAGLFLVGQLLVKDSLIARSLDHLNPQLRLVARGLTAWLEQHPEVSVRTTQNLLFYYFSHFYLPLTMIALALAIPHLITRDLSSNAIVIYSSKAVGRMDYLLGKFGALLGLMTLTWLGPVCTVWLVGNLLAPHWHFFWHARAALTNALVFIVSSVLMLAILALGVSAISKREKVPVATWLVLWLVGRFLSVGGVPTRNPTANPARPFLEHCSLTFNLDQISLGIFRLTDDLKLAQENIPIFGNLLRGIRPKTLAAMQNPDLAGAFAGLGVMLVLAALILAWRVKPE